LNELDSRIDFKNRNDLLLGWVSSLLKTYLFFLVVFISIRLFFTLYFGNSGLLLQHKWDVLQAFILGWKYDTLVLSYALIPVYITAFITSILGNVGLRNFFNFFLRIYVNIISLVLFLLLLSDMGFYSYFQDHINILFYGVIEDDTIALMGTIWKNYPVEYICIGVLLYFVFSLFILKRCLPRVPKKGSFMKPGAMKFTIINLIMFVLIAGGIRGGYSDIVIAPRYNDFSKIEFINQIAINGIVTLEKAIKLRRTHSSPGFNLAKQMGYEGQISKAFSDYLDLDVSYSKEKDYLQLISRRTNSNPLLEGSKPNVIVILMESFGAHWKKYNSMDFDFLGGLNKHFTQDYYFNNFISSGNGTIGSLMVLATNIPYRSGARFLSESRYMQLPLKSGAHIPYKENGYETSFYYGGKLGWRDIGKYFRYQNYHNVVGENGIRDELKLTGKIGSEWGVYDEHLFDSLFKKLESGKRSQFIMALSTTNHPPFEIPKNYNSPQLVIPSELATKIQREEDTFIKRFKAFEYTNQKLAEFIDKVKNSKLADNTIIAVTGDHNFWGFINYEKEETFLKHLVPFYVYVPKGLRPEVLPNLDKIGSHEDIMTSLYNLSLSNSEYISFGEDLFSPGAGYAINSNLYASEKGVIYKGADFEWSSMPLMQKTSSPQFLNDLRRHYQSTLTVADYFLRSTYSNTKSKKE
jgi:hypothetical protein